MSYKIPLFKLNFNHLEKEALIKTLDSKWISTGPQCALLEENFSVKINSKHAISMSSCTSALHLAFKALNIGEDDEVICPSLTFVASTNAILYVGAKPIFCDVIGNEDLNIDPLEIEKLITPKTKAIIVVHFAGFPCKMAEITELASKHNLKVIEDACHGPFSEYNKKKIRHNWRYRLF